MRLMDALTDFIHDNPGCTAEQIRTALKEQFPSAHFDTFLEVHASKNEFCKVNLLVPKTENHSQRLLTLYFPRGTTLGL